MHSITRLSYMSNILFITSYFLLIRINMSLVFRVMTCQFGNHVSDHSNNLDLDIVFGPMWGSQKLNAIFTLKINFYKQLSGPVPNVQVPIPSGIPKLKLWNKQTPVKSY